MHVGEQVWSKVQHDKHLKVEKINTIYGSMLCKPHGTKLSLRISVPQKGHMNELVIHSFQHQ